MALLERAGEAQGGASAEALAEEDDARVAPFGIVQFVVTVCIESPFNEPEGDAPAMVFNRFGVDAWGVTQFQRQLANAAIGVVPVVPTAEKPDHQRAAGGQGLGAREVLGALRVDG